MQRKLVVATISFESSMQDLNGKTGLVKAISLLPLQEGICRSCDQPERRRHATMNLQRRSLRAIGRHLRPSKAFSAEPWESAILSKTSRAGQTRMAARHGLQTWPLLPNLA
jgi:hypothetical protein